jgi:large subunit ribosomal protein L15
MHLSELRPAAGAVSARKRVGRGKGAGTGGTSTRGHKGGQSRSGYKEKRGFEGGQMPLHRRTPKHGFINFFRVENQIIDFHVVNRILAQYPTLECIDAAFLRERRYVKRPGPIKLLNRGTLSRKINFSLHKYSESARQAVEAIGGKITVLDAPVAVAEENQN